MSESATRKASNHRPDCASRKRLCAVLVATCLGCTQDPALPGAALLEAGGGWMDMDVPIDLSVEDESMPEDLEPVPPDLSFDPCGAEPGCMHLTFGIPGQRFPVRANRPLDPREEEYNVMRDAQGRLGIARD